MPDANTGADRSRGDRDLRSHPSYGTIIVRRVSHGTSRRLFQSDLDHQHTIRIEIAEANWLRTNLHDVILNGDSIVEIEMSPLQWADMLTGFAGNGVTPVTIRRVAGEPSFRPEPPIEVTTDEISDEVNDSLNEIIESVNDLIAHPNLSVGARRKAEGIRTQLQNKIPYFNEQFDRRVSNILADAKASISAFAQKREEDAGRQALADAPMLAPPEQTPT